MIHRSALLALFASAALSAPPAFAQTAAPQPAPDATAVNPAPDQPPPQAPPAAPDQAAANQAAQGPPAPAAAAPADQTAPAAAPPQPLVAPPAPVQAQPLATLDLFSAGRDTGLGPDFWKGSSAAIARSVIPTLAQSPLSPAAIGLARQVLANGATAPEGAGTDASLAAARARALLALGDAPAVDSIVERTPNLAGDAALSQLAAEAALITDQPDKACRVSDQLAVDRGGAYWLRLRTYCQARAGKPEAQLTFSLAQQQGADPDFIRLMGVVLAGAGDPGRASLRDGQDDALSRQLQLDLKPALADAPLPIAEHVRALPPAPPAAPPPAPGAAVPAPPPPPPPLSEADVLAALRAAKGPAASLAAAEDQAAAIDALVQAKASLANPVQLASAALYAGDLSTAQAIRASLTQDQIPGASAADLAVLDAALAAAAGKPDPQTLDRLVERAGVGEASALARARAAAAIFAPVSGPVGPAERAALAGFDLGREQASAGQRLALGLAVDAKARGDVALLSLVIAQAGGAAGPSAGDRAQLERALDEVGLAQAARALAVEGLVGLEPR